MISSHSVRALLIVGLVSSLASVGCASADQGQEDDEDAVAADEMSSALTIATVDQLAHTWKASDLDSDATTQPAFKELRLNKDGTYSYKRYHCRDGQQMPCPIVTDNAGHRYGLFFYKNHPEQGTIIKFFHKGKPHLVINYDFNYHDAPGNDCPISMRVARHIDAMKPGIRDWQWLEANQC